MIHVEVMVNICGLKFHFGLQVKMKINIAFAVVRQMKGEHRTESSSESSGE